MVVVEIRLCTVAMALEKLIICMDVVIQCYPRGAMLSIGRKRMFNVCCGRAFPPIMQNTSAPYIAPYPCPARVFKPQGSTYYYATSSIKYIYTTAIDDRSRKETIRIRIYGAQ